MANPTGQDILMLALLNRARLDPAGEAARYNIDLNEGLAAGTLGSTSSQPLAWSDALFTAAQAHSDSMIQFDYFAHTDPTNGSTPQSRGTAAGYTGGVGENIDFRGTTGAIDATGEIYRQHQDLFVDTGVNGRGHRLNILSNTYQEVGVGQSVGLYTSDGTTFNASMVTEDLGVPSTQGQFLTGIAYNDLDGDKFYSVGEGRGGISVSGRVTAAAGNYSGTISSGVQPITFSGGDQAAPVSLNATIVAGRNALINLVGQHKIETSVSVTENSGIDTIVGMGTNGLSLVGDSGNDAITGGLGNDALMGKQGSDTLAGGTGNDILYGGLGADSLNGGAGVDLASYGDASSGVFASLAQPGSNQGDAAGDSYASIEGLIGSANKDTLAAGLGGSNQLWGGTGDDSLLGLSGYNYLNGGTGSDSLFSSGGSNTIDGGTGVDLARYDYSSSGVVAALDPAAWAYNTGAAKGDTYTGVEGLVGSISNDTLFGDASSNQLHGGAGNDFLIGGAGDDALFGGSGSNKLRGGAGNDYFNFYLSEFQTGVTNTIDDFSSVAANTDHIDLIGVHPGAVTYTPLNSGTNLNVPTNTGWATIFVPNATVANVQSQTSFF